jgi:hypothetical protein
MMALEQPAAVATAVADFMADLGEFREIIE